VSPVRFLLLEFKHAKEDIDSSKNWLLKEFARLPGCQAVCIKCCTSQNLYEIKSYPDELCQLVSGDDLKAFIWEWWHDCDTAMALIHLFNVLEF
jgi:hypothetical protein